MKNKTMDIVMAEKGWMNAVTFLSWIQSFDAWIQATGVVQPIVLIFDGCSSHLCQQGLQYCKAHGIELLCLPANSSHITQPLDVSVFRGLKRKLNELFRNCRLKQVGSTLQKLDVIDLVTKAWDTETISKNAIAGFQATGLWPTSRDTMHKHWLQFDHRKQQEELPEWARAKLREEVLPIPTIATTPKKRQKKNDTTCAVLANDFAEIFEENKYFLLLLH
jgi:hypothetical protein